MASSRSSRRRSRESRIRRPSRIFSYSSRAFRRRRPRAYAKVRQRAKFRHESTQQCHKRAHPIRRSANHLINVIVNAKSWQKKLADFCSPRSLACLIVGVCHINANVARRRNGDGRHADARNRKQLWRAKIVRNNAKFERRIEWMRGERRANDKRAVFVHGKWYALHETRRRRGSRRCSIAVAVDVGERKNGKRVLRVVNDRI